MTDLQSVRVLSSESIDALRSLAAGARAQEIWDASFDELVHSHGLQLVDSRYELDDAIDLRMPEGGGSATQRFDALNARRVLRVLPGLTQAEGTDERLWSTLCLRNFRAYVHARWPFPSGNTTINSHVASHVLAGSARDRERNNAMARLWWSGRYVERIADPAENSQLLDAFFANSDLSVQLLGRPNLAAIPEVAHAALALAHRYFVVEDLSYGRDAWRDFLKGIDFAGGRDALGIHSRDEVLELVTPIFTRAFGIST